MLSIITCSINEKKFQNLSNSIKETIGINYELIKIDNLKEKLPITKAYNKGASLAIYEYLLFIHEDVEFITQNWGQLILRHLRTLPNVGVIGVAGTRYVSRIPSGWWINDDKYLNKNILLHHNYTTDKPPELRRMNAEKSVEVKALDGVFLSCKKKTWEYIKFNKDLPGFHGYDYDFTLRSSLKYCNYFINDVFMRHFSAGNLTKEWYRNTLLIYENNNVILALKEANEAINLKVEKKSFEQMVFMSLKFEDTLFEKIKMFIKFNIMGYRIIGIPKTATIMIQIIYKIIKNKAIA